MLCIINALHYEAGNQSNRGQRAVFDVIENRSRLWSKGYCQVIKQKNQFSFYPKKWKKSLDSEDWKIYYDVVVARDRVLDEDVMWYHADYVKPSWTKKLSRDKQIGVHIFYKEK